MPTITIPESATTLPADVQVIMGHYALNFRAEVAALAPSHDHNPRVATMTTPTNLQRAILRADGTITPLDAPVTLAKIEEVLGAGAFPGTIDLHDGRVLLIDDQGVAKRLPRNEAATALYHSICKPGTTTPVLGDAVLALDADFGDPEDF